jgi:hypothetical protein
MTTRRVRVQRHRKVKVVQQFATSVHHVHSGEQRYYDVESLSYECSNMAEAKFKALDTWLWKECEIGDMSEPQQMNLNIIGARQTSIAEDPLLFGPGLSPRGCYLEKGSRQFSDTAFA